ncbi:penicillin-binding transpeptidase domain-containing protein [Caviibacter abscessus]|uniref:penicillin-binding transpeptidase domain-containing protein n=1 Tax=Caviibacter abscessus TaxID=1766719 RepID=UPI00082CD660|nr:penicillin-binding transpeptidase domain-containing protein [Caviibacter abscessus]
MTNIIIYLIIFFVLSTCIYLVIYRSYVAAYLFLVFAFFVIAIGKLVYLQAFTGIDARENLDKKRHGIENIQAKRGAIITSDNHKLSFDIDKYKIIIDPTNIPEVKLEDVITIISQTISLDRQELKNKINEKREKKKKYLDLEIEITYEKEKELKENLKKLKIKENWIFFNQFSQRYVIEDNAFESILGFLNKENQPVYGLEKVYDEHLRGKPGKARIYRAALGSLKNYTLQSLTDYEILEPAQEGHSIKLTIDSVIQYELDTVLKDTFNKFQAESVMGVVIETQTGKVIAMDSFPKASNKSEIKNRVITDLFEPGSIFKPITISAAMEEKLINKNTVISSDGNIRVKNRIIHDHDKTTVGSLTVEQIVANSGNVALVKIGQMMETDKFYEYLKAFGLGQKTKIDTAYEANGKLFSLKDFSEVRKSNVSFGQGISMTQLQMIMALNATINGGKLLKPYIVDKAIDSNNNVVFENKPEVLHNVISESTSNQMKEMLEKVVTSGTGRQAAIEGYRIGGKTGTAQKAGARGYEKGKYFSSFFAFIPADKPKYSILITVNEPKGAYYGAAVALPPVKVLLERLIKYKGLLPTLPIEQPETPIQDSINNIKKVPKDLEYIKHQFEIGYMPDVTGLSIKSIIKVFPYSKFPNLKFTGVGIVQSQNIPAGTLLNKDTQIILECR